MCVDHKRYRPFFAGVLLFICGLLSAAGVCGQNKVTDGNFEDGTPFTDATDIANQYQVFSTTKQMKYWTVTYNTVNKDYKAYLGMGCPVGGLDHHIDMNPLGEMEQMMHGLTPGTKYALSFYTRVHQSIVTSCAATGAATLQIDVKDGGTTLLTDILVLTRSDASWAKRSYEFVATKDSALLRFSGTGSCTGSGGVLLDRVEVIASGVDPCVPYTHFAHAGKDTAFCSLNGVADIVLSASGGDIYAWSPGIYFADSTVATATAKIDQTTVFVVTVTNEYGCVDKDTVLATVYPGPVVRVSPKEVSACINEEVALSVSGALTYSWSPAEGLDAVKSANPRLRIIRSGMYVASGMNDKGCVARDTVLVTAFPLPDLNITADQTQLDCFHNMAELSATGAQQYRWEPAQYCEQPNGSSTYARPPATMVFSLTGTNAQGCKATDTITIFLKGESVVRMPNAFTPNGDHLNDEARPVLYCDFVLQEFSIYNRAGKRVFSTNNLQKGWDGNFNGTPCDPNVYFYMIRGKDNKGQDVISKGDITLVR